jgi:hypothetical protein
MEDTTELISPEKQKMLDEQHKWYAFIPALFGIIQELEGRTLDLLSSKKEEKKFGCRYLYARTIDYLKMHLDALGVSNGKKLINLYRSIAHLKLNSTKVFTYNLAIRTSDPNYIEFDKNYANLITSFDLAFDLDSPTKDIMDAWNVAKELKKILDTERIPFYVKPSGQRGWHFIIPYNYMPSIDPMELLKIHHSVLYNLAGIYGWKDYIDVSVASHPKTLIKCAYSFDNGNISLPLTDDQFNNFRPEIITSEYVLKNVILKNRGLLTRTHELSEEELKKNVQKFLDDYK